MYRAPRSDNSHSVHLCCQSLELFQTLSVSTSSKVVVTLVTSHTCNLLIQKSGTYIVASAILSVVIVIGIQNASVMEWHLVFFQHFQM